MCVCGTHLKSEAPHADTNNCTYTHTVKHTNTQASNMTKIPPTKNIQTNKTDQTDKIKNNDKTHKINNHTEKCNADNIQNGSMHV